LIKNQVFSLWPEGLSKWFNESINPGSRNEIGVFFSTRWKVMPVTQISLENNLIQLCEIFLKDLTDPLSIIDSEYRIYWANRRRAGEHNLSDMVSNSLEVSK
jgi:hypothetical protein